MSTTSPGDNELTRMSATLFIWYFTSWPSLQWPWTSTATNLLKPQWHLFEYSTHGQNDMELFLFVHYIIIFLSCQNHYNVPDDDIEGTYQFSGSILSVLSSFYHFLAVFAQAVIKLSSVLYLLDHASEMIWFLGHVTHLLFLKGNDCSLHSSGNA